MKVVLGKMSGFCGGVIKSVNEVEKLLKEYGNVYCLGELVHNRQVVSDFEKKGVVFINELSDVPDGSNVVIRAHGVPKEVYEETKRRNITLFDLTCPNVLKIHNAIEYSLSDDTFLVLIAQKSHPETIGSISFCGKNSLIIEDDTGIDRLFSVLEYGNFKKIVIFSQTTFSLDKFNALAEEISKRSSGKYEVVVHNTICNATEMRQNEVKKLAQKVEAMIIIGGKNSSNTKKLFDIASKICDNSFIVETLDDLEHDFSNYSIVGVMAGASTPKSSIDEVVNYLNSL